MNVSIKEREKICPQCNSSFMCCTGKCWCDELPNIMTISEKGECFCPNCLEAIIREKIKTSMK